MSPETKRRVQLAFLVAFALVGIRLGYILYQRSQPGVQSAAKREEQPLDPDYYVVPKKLVDYDLKSLKRDLSGRTVWVREGYRFTFYPYDRQRQRVNLAHESGTLGPIERLDIKDVVLAPGARQQQLMAVFDKNGASYAFPVGAVSGGQYEIVASEILFIQDPHELYRHWPAEVWQAIERHQVKPGMNEIQATFAIGMGVPERQSSTDEKTVHYPNGGNPVTILYRNGRAAEITRG